MIEIQNLSKSFDGHKVLHHLDVTIRTSETMVIIGRSGCGKSVLLKHMIGLIKPDEGSVLVDGVDDLSPAELSGGMRKRVGLARALAMNPEIILYDEPTTGIDPIMGDIINDLIIALRDRLNVTSIVVTHDMRSAYKVADRIAMLYNGVIVEAGTPGDIRESKNPVVRQFIEGAAIGPIQEGLPDRRILSRWSSRSKMTLR